MVKNGVRGILNQGAHSTRGGEFAELRMWVLAQAMQNVETADGQKLVDEFVAAYYGPASA